MKRNSIDWNDVIVTYSKGKEKFVVLPRKASGREQDSYSMYTVDSSGEVVKDWGSHPSLSGVEKFAVSRGYIKETTMKKTKVIEIQEEVQLPGTNLILEKGDRIRVIEKLRL